MPAKQVTVYIPEPEAKALEAVAAHYRWKTSQAIVGYIRFYEELRDFVSNLVINDHLGVVYFARRGENGEVEELEEVTDDGAFIALLKKLHNGMVADFKDVEGFLRESNYPGEE